MKFTKDSMLLEPARTIYDFPFYRDVPKKSAGRVFAYLAYMGLIYSILAVGFAYFKLNPVIRDIAEWLSTSAPPITLSDGKASSALTAPLILRYPKYGKLAILIDTNRTTPVSYDEMQKDDVDICLIQNSIYASNPQQNTAEAYPLSDIRTSGPTTIAGDMYLTLAKWISRLMFIAGFFILWAFFVAFKLIANVFYAFVGLLINALAATELQFQDLFKLAIYAQTPMIVLQLMMLLFGRPLSMYASVPLSLLVTSAYLWQAIRQTKTTGPA